MAAEYIVSSGNPNVILCERGIRTFETYTRNTMDLAAVPLLHHLTHLPVIVDPSHATGKRWLVKPLAIGGVAVGADGVMVEVHPNPDEALSDAEQQLDARPVPRPDGRHRPGPRARPRPLPPAAVRAAIGRRRLDGWPDRRGRDRVARRARPAARRPAPARRQVDQPSSADAGRPGRGREPDRRAPATAPTSARRRAIVAALGATVERLSR